jgi:hypothetical protein
MIFKGLFQKCTWMHHAGRRNRPFWLTHQGHGGIDNILKGQSFPDVALIYLYT